MADNDNKFAEELIRGVFAPKDTLVELFERRIEELKITPTSALQVLGMGQNTLHGILNGTQQTVNFSNLLKMADFLQLPKEEVINLYLKALDKNFPTQQSEMPEKIQFIKENFDLAALKKSGFIKSISDYSEIEKKITYYFGLKSIFEYKRPTMDVAFSSGLVKPKNELSRSFFIRAAHDQFESIDNPYEYDRDALIKYFPEIRWHSTNVELGLKNVVRDLFKMGVTVIYIPPLSSLHLRGATFSVDDKPSIVLTDYVGFYPTLWFALVHELFHVLFDWEEIKSNSYHLTDDDNEQLSVREREQEADNFAREYLFSKEKTDTVKPYLNNHSFVNEFAKNNHVHPSFIYVFYAKDAGKIDRMAWPRAKKQNPNIKDCIASMENPWAEPLSITAFVKSKKHKIYN